VAGCRKAKHVREKLRDFIEDGLIKWISKGEFEIVKSDF
jgi:hypothetical protein